MMRFISFLLALCLAGAVQAVEDKPQVLLLMNSKVMAKANLLEELARDQPFELNILTEHSKMEEEELAAQWSKARLVLLDGINPILSGAMFDAYQPLLQRFANIPVVALGNIDSVPLNQPALFTSID